MAKAQAAVRPTSPHLQVWRWHVTMFASIVHRGAGIFLYLGAIALVVWLAALAIGVNAYDALMSAIPGWAFAIAIYAGMAALAFHLFNGVRHLFWDAGRGFQPRTTDVTAWLVILLAMAAPIGLYFLIRTH